MRFTIYNEDGEQMRKLWDKEAAEAYIRLKDGWYFTEAKKFRNKRINKVDWNNYEPAPF